LLLAIPHGELTKVLNGDVGEVRAALKNATNANADIEVEVALIDPMKRLRSVSVHYLRSDLVKNNPAANEGGDWPELPGARQLTLRLEGRRAIGALTVLTSDKDRAFTYQASYTDATGRRVFGKPRSLRAIAANGPVVVRPPNVPWPPRDGPRPPLGVPPPLNVPQQPAVRLGPSKPATPVEYQP
jgi:hypothetical protein